MIIQNNREELGKALQYVEDELKKYNLKSREATMTMLMAEESIVCMMSHTKEHENIEIVFKKLFGNISLNISARGETFDISEESILIGDMDFDGVSGDAEATIRNLIIRSQSDIFQYKNKLHQKHHTPDRKTFRENAALFDIGRNAVFCYFRNCFKVIITSLCTEYVKRVLTDTCKSNVFKCIKDDCWSGGILFYCYLSVSI